MTHPLQVTPGLLHHPLGAATVAHHRQPRLQIVIFGHLAQFDIITRENHKMPPTRDRCRDQRHCKLPQGNNTSDLLPCVDYTMPRHGKEMQDDGKQGMRRTTCWISVPSPPSPRAHTWCDPTNTRNLNLKSKNGLKKKK